MSHNHIGTNTCYENCTIVAVYSSLVKRYVLHCTSDNNDDGTGYCAVLIAGDRDMLTCTSDEFKEDEVTGWLTFPWLPGDSVIQMTIDGKISGDSRHIFKGMTYMNSPINSYNTRSSENFGSHMPLDTSIHWYWANPLHLIWMIILIGMGIALFTLALG